MKRVFRLALSSSTDSGLVPVGRCGRPHGLRGDVTVLPTTDDASRFLPGSRLVTADGSVLTVVRSSPHRDRGLVVAFEGHHDRGGAESLRGLDLFAEAATRRHLSEGEFWPDELVGLTAIDPDGSVLGEVTAVELATAQDRLVITTADGVEVLVPFVSALVGEATDDTIVIHDPGGLFPGP